jgi:hypothetical protein
MLMASRDRDNDAAMSDKELIDEVLTLDRRGTRNHGGGAHLDLVSHQSAPDTQAQLQAEADRSQRR